MKVLIADDNCDLAENLGEILHGAGYEPVIVHDGGEAVECARSVLIDVAVLDIAMPIKSGIQACSEINVDHPDLPVILMTGYEQRPDHAMQVGGKEIVAALCALALECQLGHLGVGKRIRKRVQPADPRAVGNRFDVEREDRGQVSQGTRPSSGSGPRDRR